MGVPKSESLDELHMATANGSMHRISADVKAPSRETEPENAPAPRGYQSPKLLLSAPDDEGYHWAESVQPERRRWGTKLRVGLEQIEIDGEGVPRSDRWHQNGSGRIQKGL